MMIERRLDETATNFLLNSKLLSDLRNCRDMVSIVIPVWNELDCTKLMLESLKSNTKWNNYEVIVVDNGSNKPTRDYLIECGIPDKVIQFKENCGFPQAVNIGIRASKGKYIVIANNDIILTKMWLTKLLNVAEDDDKIAIVSPLRVQTIKDEKYTVCDYQIEFLENFPAFDFGNRNAMLPIPELIKRINEFSEKITRKFSGAYLDNKNRMVPFFCVLFKRWIFEKIGLLDEAYGWGLHEDVDFCKLVIEAGYKIAIALDCYIFHFMSKSVFKLFGGYEETIKYIEYNRKTVFKKKYG